MFSPIFVAHLEICSFPHPLPCRRQVDSRTIEKYEKEAKEKNRESWFLAFIMDTNEEERAKGKTVEVGRAHFDSPSKRFAKPSIPTTSCEYLTRESALSE